MITALVFLALLCLSQARLIVPQENTATEIAEIVEGIFIGYFKQSFPIQDCIQDTEIIVEDIEKAVYYLKQGVNIKDVSEAFIYLGQAVLKVPTTLRECESCAGVLSEFKKLAIVFANPALFLADVGKNVFWHFRDITKDISEAKNSWNSKDYKSFGIFIGELIATATKVRKVEKVQGVKEVAQVIEGVMIGMFGQEFAIEQCLSEGDALWEDLTKTAFYLKSGKLSDIGEAFKYVGDAFQKLPLALKDCKNAEGIIKEFEKVKDVFSSPLKFLSESGLRVLWHFRDITADIKGAHANWDAKNYLEFGKFIGMIGKIAFGGDLLEVSVPTITVDNLFTFLHHYWYAAFGLNLELVLCDVEGKKAVEIVNEIISLYNLGMHSQALVYFLNKQSEIVGLFSHCRSGAKEFIQGVTELAWLESPGHAIDAMNNAVRHHYIAFPKDVIAAKNALASGDFARLGDVLGELTDFVLEEC